MNLLLSDKIQQIGILSITPAPDVTTIGRKHIIYNVGDVMSVGKPHIKR